jgi:hypothetical protein
MLQFQTLNYRKIILDKLYPPLVLSAWITFHEVTSPPTALFESPRDKYTIFVSRIHPWAEALGWILKTKWRICPWSMGSLEDFFWVKSGLPQKFFETCAKTSLKILL